MGTVHGPRWHTGASAVDTQESQENYGVGSEISPVCRLSLLRCLEGAILHQEE